MQDQWKYLNGNISDEDQGEAQHVSGICDPPQEFDAKGESTRTTRLHDTLSVP